MQGPRSASSRGRLGGLLLALGALLAAPGCPAEDPVACTRDADCPEGGRCVQEIGGGFCGCATDEACDAAEFCNSSGRCQRRPGCYANGDCPEGRFCDLTLGVCIEGSACGTDVHCPLGAVCVSDELGCVAGCTQHGDCPLYQLCDLREADRHPQGLGACFTACDSTAGCPLGFRCVGGACFESPNASHCAPCNGGLDCPNAKDWCLINGGYAPERPETGGPFQCAIDCDGQPQLCPNGYVCGDVVRLTEDPCEIDEQCFGVRRCIIGEGQTRGFCSCSRDDDCSYARVPPTCTLAGCLFPPGRLCGDASDCEAVERCGDHANAGTNVCYRNRNRTCESYRDCLCVEGRCIRDGRTCVSWEECEPTCRGGSCRIGAACSPEEGLYCPDLRGG